MAKHKQLDTVKELGKLRGYCSSCGLPITKTDKYCPKCGAFTSCLSKDAPAESRIFLTRNVDSLIFGEFKLKHGV